THPARHVPVVHRRRRVRGDRGGDAPRGRPGAHPRVPVRTDAADGTRVRRADAERGKDRKRDKEETLHGRGALGRCATNSSAEAWRPSDPSKLRSSELARNRHGVATTSCLEAACLSHPRVEVEGRSVPAGRSPHTYFRPKTSPFMCYK